MGKILKEYNNKRNFQITEEPRGTKTNPGTLGKNLFVIQKHDATNLHYDFRLLVDGVLKSWAVPKGPSTDPKVKRLAVQTEDHPLEYADFEGIIPEDQYGGGTVMVWDAGTYENEKKDKEGNEVSITDQLKKGKCTVVLHGKKLKGGYTLIKIGKGKDKDNNWLLKKIDDEEADARRNPTNTQNKSVLTGRTMTQIKRDYKKKK